MNKSHMVSAHRLSPEGVRKKRNHALQGHNRSTKGDSWIMGYCRIPGERLSLIIIVERFSRAPLSSVIVRDLNRKTITRVFDKWVSDYGQPEEISLDTPPEYDTGLTCWACKNGVKLTVSQSWAPLLEGILSKLKDEMVGTHEPIRQNISMARLPHEKDADA